MNTGRTPEKEEGYRFLREGEIIRDGDEFFDAFQLTWVEANATIGLDVDAASVKHYRRATK